MSQFIKTFSGATKGHKISKHRSKATNLTVTLVQSDCPIVKCFISLATEEDSNDGRPHTLEHLVFMGSEEYSKGVLDFAANQCLARGTNAWTDIDHTAYTVECAGSEGFLTFLPIYLDHVLFPNLTPEAFATEIHHINEDGDDAGVAYCEMQSCENSMESLVWRDLQDAIYMGNSGYKMETGGIMENLRTTCTFERVKEYHDSFYRPENTNVIICGKVEIEDVLGAISSIEAKLEKRVYRDYAKPWSKPSPIFKESKVIKTVFPGELGEPGHVTIAWKGLPLEDVYMLEAHSVLWEYLTVTAVSPFIMWFVELCEPYCSSVSVEVDEYNTTVTKLNFASTSDKQNDISNLTFKLLEKVKEDGLDMSRLTTILNNRTRLLTNLLETHSENYFSDMLVLDQLYGNDDHVMLTNNLEMFSHLTKLLNADEEFWLEILSHYIEQPAITSVASACPDFMESLEVKEKERVEKQILELGEDKLELYGQQLLEALELNNTPLDKVVLSGLAKPNIESIKFPNVTSNCASNNPFDSQGLFFHQADTSFCTFMFVNDSRDLPERMKKYLPLFEDLLCNTHIASDDVYLKYDEVIKLKERLFFHTSFSTGRCQEQFIMEFQFLADDYKECTEFMRNAIFNSIITEERLHVMINKQQANIVTSMRSGDTVLTSVDYLTSFSGGCNRAGNKLIQKQFLAESKEIIPELCLKMEQFQQKIFSSNVLHIIGNKSMLDKVDKDEITSMFRLTDPIIPCTSIKQFRENKTLKMIHKVATDESSCLQITIPCPILESEKDHVVMKVISRWVGALDGAFGREIRGQGFAYHYAIRNDTEDGSLEFFIGQATDLGKAYLAAKAVFDDVINNDLLDECQIELAKGAATFDLINKYDTPRSTVIENLYHIHKGHRVDLHLEQLSQLKDVTLSDCMEVIKAYHVDLFDSDKCKVVVCCAVNKFDEIKNDLESGGIVLTEVEKVEELII